jgi:spermidine synthase
MTGMTAGGLWSTHELNRTQNDLKKFIILLLLLAVYLLMLMTIFIGLKYLTTDIFSTAAMKFFILAGTTCCGFLIGAQFPLANKIYLDSNKRIGQSAGLLYSADLAGAWLGGIIVTAFLIPVYGIINTVLVFLAVNLISLCSLHFAIRR